MADNRLKRRLQILIVGLLGAALTLFGYSYSLGLEKQREQAALAKVLGERQALLKKEIDTSVESLQLIAELFETSLKIDRDAYRTVTKPLLRRHPEFWGIHWVPYVSAEQRPAFEALLQEQGFDRGITALVEVANGLRPSAEKAFYYPILFTEPLEKNRMIVGFDTHSRNFNSQAMQQAHEAAGQSVSTAPFKLVQDRHGSLSVVIYNPVYQARQASLPYERPSGFIAALLKPQMLLDKVVGNQEQLAISLVDVEPGRQIVVAEIGQNQVRDGWLSAQSSFETLGRKLQLNIALSPLFLLDHGYSRSQGAMWILVLGAGFTLLLGLILVNLSVAHARICDERNRSQRYLDTVETFVIALDRSGRIQMVNRKGCELLGYSEAELLGEEWFSDRFQFNSSVLRDSFRHLLQSPVGSEKTHYSESTLQTVAGDQVMMAWHNAVQTENGKVTGVLCSGENITQQRYLTLLDQMRSEAMQASLQGRPLAEVLAMVVLGIERQKNGAKCSILLLDSSGKHLVTGAAPSLPESYNAVVNGVEIGDYVGSCGTAAFRQERIVVEDIQTHPYWQDYRELAAIHNLRSCWSEPIFGKNGRLLGTFAIYHEEPSVPSKRDLELIKGTADFVSILIEEAQIEESLIRLANTDELTGLANRRKFMKRLDDEVRRSRRYQHPLALCMLDLDFFKKINDSYGHEIGDLVLQHIAGLLRAELRDCDLPGRIGGEEFALLLPETTPEMALGVAERIRQKVEAAVIRLPHGEELKLTASLGLAMVEHPEDYQGLQANELLSRADHCLYYAKQHGRNQVSQTAGELEGHPEHHIQGEDSEG